MKKSPEFKALESLYETLRPLSPESRRRIIAALHDLLEIGEGKAPGKGFKGPGPKKARQ